MSISAHAGRNLDIHFKDIIDENSSRGVEVKVSLERIAALVSPHDGMDRQMVDNYCNCSLIIFSYICYAAPCVVKNPGAEEREALDAEFHHLSNHVAQATASIAFLVGKIFSEVIHNAADTGTFIGSFKMTVKSRDLPLGAGLGSSAAFSVAVAASLLNLRAKVAYNEKFSFLASRDQLAAFLPGNSRLHGADNLEGGACVGDDGGICDTGDVLATVNAWAFASEMLLHGAPSGLDNTTSCFGGLVKFKKNTNREGPSNSVNEVSLISDCPPIHILLVNTKVPRSTKRLVSAVRAMYDKYTDLVSSILDVMNSIALSFCDLLEK